MILDTIQHEDLAVVIRRVFDSWAQQKWCCTVCALPNSLPWLEKYFQVKHSAKVGLCGDFPFELQTELWTLMWSIARTWGEPFFDILFLAPLHERLQIDVLSDSEKYKRSVVSAEQSVFQKCSRSCEFILVSSFLSNAKFSVITTLYISLLSLRFYRVSLW